MGLATAYHLARDGRRVLLLEARAIGNVEGSSHGPSRIIRLTYQSEDYIELARASFALWEELGEESGEPLLVPCGGLDFGPPDARNLAALGEAMTRAGVPHETIDAAEIRRRFPLLTPPDDAIGFYQPDYAVLPADRCLAGARDGREGGGRRAPRARAGARCVAGRRGRRGAHRAADLPCGTRGARARFVARAPHGAARCRAAAHGPEGAGRLLRAGRSRAVRTGALSDLHPALPRLAHVRGGIPAARRVRRREAAARPSGPRRRARRPRPRDRDRHPGAARALRRRHRSRPHRAA